LFSTYVGALAPALAQTDGIPREALNELIDTADKVCTPGTLPNGQAPLSSSTQVDVSSQLNDLSQKLTIAGATVTADLTSENYQGILRDQIAATSNNNAQCKIEVLKSLLSRLPAKPSPEQNFSVTRQSGWRGGGYNQGAWCNDLIAILKGEHPQGRFQVAASSEQNESRCAPFKCPQYNYSCTVQVTTPSRN
jgi:hypothetical protein